MRIRILLQYTVLAAATLTFLGCQSPASQPPAGSIPFNKGGAVPVVVAVMDLENQAGYSGQGNLGNGMADMLVTHLMETKKVVVIERQNLRDILGELSLQQQGLSRQEGRAASGRLMNAKYLIRGAVTDFGVIQGASGWLGQSGFKLFGGGSQAQVTLHLRVYDVESGEIMASMKAEGRVSAGSAGVAAHYENLNVGGEAFKRTPLGKATERAIKAATSKLLEALPVDYWHPLVAECDNGLVVINGGENVRLQDGDEFIVRGKPHFVTDPATGNVIDTIAGQPVGRIKVQKTGKLSSTATLVEGTAQRGQSLEPVPREN